MIVRKSRVEIKEFCSGLLDDKAQDAALRSSPLQRRASHEKCSAAMRPTRHLHQSTNNLNRQLHSYSICRWRRPEYGNLKRVLRDYLVVAAISAIQYMSIPNSYLSGKITRLYLPYIVSQIAKVSYPQKPTH